jgi:glycosyltransferase involved in cell wall biosynthesis
MIPKWLLLKLRRGSRALKSRGLKLRPQPESDLARYFSSNGHANFRLERGDRVAVCTWGLGPGGAERQWVYLARDLQSAGYDVIFVTFCSLLGQDGHYAPLLSQYKIPLFDASKLSESELLSGLRIMPQMKRLIEGARIAWVEPIIRLSTAFDRLKPKALFLQLDDPNILGGVAGIFCGIPRIVVSFRNQNPTRIEWINQDWYFEGYRLLARSEAVRFVANSEHGGKDYADWIGLTRERVHFIANTIDPDQFPRPSSSELQKLRRSLMIEATAPVLLGVLRLTPEKDPTTFIEVASRVSRAIPGVKILHCGSEPKHSASMREQLEKRVDALGLRSSISFLGQRNDVSALFGLADLVLCTSRVEGMSNTIVEAQFMETPVVATAIPGIIENVSNGQSAILCPVGDVDRLSEACIEVLLNKSRAVKMGAAGRRYVLERSPRVGLASRYVEVLHSAL